MRDRSITHHHLLGVVVTELQRRQGQASKFRILDVGCGKGAVIDFLQTRLHQMFPAASFELFGFDVADSRVQKGDFFRDTLNVLGSHHPYIDWSARVKLIESPQQWPFEAREFDFVLSNHVMEHVRDVEHMFSEVRRVLKPNGVSAHLFPLADSWMEWHLKIPFAHWVTNGDLLKDYIRMCSWLGLGTWRRYCRKVEPISLDAFARANRDFIVHETNYLQEKDIHRYSKATGLRYSFRYTEDFYLNRLRWALGLKAQYEFPSRNSFVHRLKMVALRRISSITLVLEQDNTYENRGLHSLEIAAQ